jgi:uncharacterized phiE125 gp8 family phage protein
MKTSRIKTAPASYPVSLMEAKTQLRIVSTDTTYDTEITRLITAASQWIERRYGISLITQTRVQYQDNFYEKYPIFRNFLGPYYSRYPVTLLYPPVQSVTSLRYYDTSQVLQTLTEDTDFTVAGKMAPMVGAQDIETPRIWPISSWPVFKWIPDTIQIEYVSGFGNDSTFVPETIKTAVLMVLSHFFENRMEEITGERIAKFEMSVDRVMSSYENFQHVNLYA